MLYRKEANSRDRKSNIEKGEGGSIVEMRKEIRLKYYNIAKCLNTFVAHWFIHQIQLTFIVLVKKVSIYHEIDKIKALFEKLPRPIARRNFPFYRLEKKNKLFLVL